MSRVSYSDSDIIHRAMLDGINSHLEAALRRRFKEVADKIVEEAIKDAMKTFEVAANAYRDPSVLGTTIQVLLRDERKK